MLISPRAPGTGNRISSDRWAQMLSTWVQRVVCVDADIECSCADVVDDVMKAAKGAPVIVIAVHAYRSGRLALEALTSHDSAKLIVVLAGTDINDDSLWNACPSASPQAHLNRAAGDVAGPAEKRSVLLAAFTRASAVVALSVAMATRYSSFIAAHDNNQSPCSTSGTHTYTSSAASLLAKLSVIPQGIDAAAATVAAASGSPEYPLSMRESLGLPPHARVFLLVASLRPVKDPVFVARAVRAEHTRRDITAVYEPHSAATDPIDEGVRGSGVRLNTGALNLVEAISVRATVRAGDAAASNSTHALHYEASTSPEEFVILGPALDIETADAVAQVAGCSPLLTCVHDAHSSRATSLSAYSAVSALPPSQHVSLNSDSVSPHLDGHNAPLLIRQALSDGHGVSYHPTVPHATALRWIREADVLVNSSTAEGQSTALLEGMALGTPIVARRNEGNVALLVPGEIAPRVALGAALSTDGDIHRVDACAANVEDAMAAIRPRGFIFDGADEALRLCRHTCSGTTQGDVDRACVVNAARAAVAQQYSAASESGAWHRVVVATLGS